MQADVVATATRFNRLSPSLGERLPAPLIDALHGVSSVRAYAAVQLLEALGTAQAAQSAPGLRRQIIESLAQALRDGDSRRPIWVLNAQEIGNCTRQRQRPPVEGPPEQAEGLVETERKMCRPAWSNCHQTVGTHST